MQNNLLAYTKTPLRTGRCMQKVLENCSNNRTLTFIIIQRIIDAGVPQQLFRCPVEVYPVVAGLGYIGLVVLTDVDAGWPGFIQLGQHVGFHGWKSWKRGTIDNVISVLDKDTSVFWIYNDLGTTNMK